MTRTKQEVRDYLDGLVGKVCVDKSNHRLNGQCVCMIKNLMEFLGVPNPYAARGNAKDAGNNYIAQGIGTRGRGWLTICINPNMAAPYGHIWVDLAGEANYESNGAVALRVTKNTRPISQARQFVSFDKWIKADTKPVPPKEVKMVTYQQLEVLYRFYFGTGVSEYGMKHRLGKQTFEQAQASLVSSKEFKSLVKERQDTQVGFHQHLPVALRKVIKLKEQE